MDGPVLRARVADATCEITSHRSNDHDIVCWRGDYDEELVNKYGVQSLQEAKDIGCSMIHGVPKPAPPPLTREWADRCSSMTAAAFGLCVRSAPRLELLHDVTGALTKAGWKIEGIPLDRAVKVGEFARRHPRGYYLVTTHDHVMALVDGQLVDTARRGKDNRRTVEFAHRLTWPYRGDEPPIFLREARERGLLFRGLRRR